MNPELKWNGQDFYYDDFKFPPDYNDIFALNRAIRSGSDDLYRFSLSKLVNQVDGSDYTPLDYAVERGNIDAVRILLNHNVDLRSQGLKAMALAARHGHLEILELLLPKVVKATHLLRYYYSFECSLHEAAFGRQYGIAKWAIDNGADINCKFYGRGS